MERLSGRVWSGVLDGVGERSPRGRGGRGEALAGDGGHALAAEHAHEARLAQHRTGTGAKYTRGRGPLTLLASAEFPTKHDAMSAEYRFKRLTRDKKDALLAKAAASKEPFERILEEAFA